MKLLTNLCTLEEKKFHKDYETLIKAGTIGKAILGLANLFKNDEKCREISQSKEGQTFIAESFYFLEKCLNPATDSESLVGTYSALLSVMTE